MHGAGIMLLFFNFVYIGHRAPVLSTYMHKARVDFFFFRFFSIKSLLVFSRTSCSHYYLNSKSAFSEERHDPDGDLKGTLWSVFYHL